MKRPNKYLYGWKLFINYGGGWEYETFEETREAYKVNRKAYAENCTYPQRWSRGRELNPAFSEKVFTCPTTEDMSGVCTLCGFDLSGHGSDYQCLSLKRR